MATALQLDQPRSMPMPNRLRGAQHPWANRLQLTDAAETAICDEYSSGQSITNTSRCAGISITRAKLVLSKHGIALRKIFFGRNARLKRENPEVIAAAYASGKTSRDVAREFHISKDALRDLLKERRVYRDVHESHRKYECDHHFFDKIDSEEKAYWLGFLMADGNVQSKTNGVRLQLALKDSDHLAKFARSLRSNHRIIEVPNRGYGAKFIAINSPGLVSGLIRHGVTPRKSFTATPPKLEPDLERHFYRGMVDGDGWVRADTTGKPIVGLCGSKNTIDAFREFIKSVTGHEYSTRKQVNIFVIEATRGVDAATMMHYMYGKSTVFLDRKKLRAEHLWDWRPLTSEELGLKQRMFSPEQELEIVRSGLSSRVEARKRGCNRMTIQRLRIRHKLAKI